MHAAQGQKFPPKEGAMRPYFDSRVNFLTKNLVPFLRFVDSKGQPANEF